MGQRWPRTRWGQTGGGLEPPSSLPTTGTYTIVIDPSGTYTGTITLTLMSYLSGNLNVTARRPPLRLRRLVRMPGIRLPARPASG
ncbi:MAG: hypothetical protein QM706_06280 [Nitrospira sp.]